MTGAVLPYAYGGVNMAENIGISSGDTIENAIERWLYRYKKQGVKTATFNRLASTFSLTKEHRIASVRILDLCTDDIQGFINAIANEGYSYSTIKKAYNLMTGFIRFVIGEGIAIRPAHLNVVLPKAENLRKQAKQLEAYDPDQQARLKEAIESSQTVGAYAALFMLETGARVGEVLALRWSDIQWARRAVRIHATMVNPGSRRKCFVQNSAKSKSSMRTIPLSTTAMEMLSRIRGQNDGLIFVASDGESSIGYTAIRKQVQDLCRLAGVPYYGMHCFRHTFATNAFYKGCEIKILSKLLGHASVTITYNTYIHLYGDALEEMRGIVG